MFERVVVVTSPETMRGETETWVNLLKAGLQRLHIRKPFHSKAETASLIQKVPAQWREKLVIHHHPGLVQDMGLGGCHCSYSDITAGNIRNEAVSCSVHSWMSTLR